MKRVDVFAAVAMHAFISRADGGKVDGREIVNRSVEYAERLEFRLGDLFVLEGDVKMHDAEEALIRRALQRNGGNKLGAARELGMPPRTLYRRLQRYGIECRA